MSNLQKAQSSAAIFFNALKQTDEIHTQLQIAEVDKLLKGKGAKGGKSKGADGALAIASKTQDATIHTMEATQDGIGKALELGSQAPWEKGAGGLPKGLTTAFVNERLAADGKNELTERAGSPWYVNFLKEMTGFFSLLLWFGAFLCFIGYGIQKDKDDKANLYLGIVLSTVVFITGCFSYQ